ncbi:hypothetical protein Ancab_020375 [Ancistrocladus abbreviatus]
MLEGSQSSLCLYVNGYYSSTAICNFSHPFELTCCSLNLSLFLTVIVREIAILLSSLSDSLVNSTEILLLTQFHTTYLLLMHMRRLNHLEIAYIRPLRSTQLAT